MTTPLEKFRQLTRAFEPCGQGPEDSYVPTVHEDFRRQLEKQLLLNEHTKLLLAGQPGCGKTTLLLHMAHELRCEGRLVALIGLETLTAVQDLGSAEIHMAAVAELLSQAGKTGISLPQSTLAGCRRLLEAASGSTAEEPQALSRQLSRFLLKLRDLPELRQSFRSQLDQQEMLHLLSTLLTDLKPHHPIIILDGLDKLAPEPAREALLRKQTRPMVDLPGATILTIPLSLVYEPAFNVLGEWYNNSDNAVLPAVGLYDFNCDTRKRTLSQRGFGVLRQVIEARTSPIEPGLILPDAAEKAILGSGGNLRELVRLIQSSIIKAAVRESEFIELVDMEQVLIDQRESFRRASQPRFLPVLRKIRDEAQLNDTGNIGRLLLHGLWALEYRDDSAWHCLRMPVEQMLG